MLPDRQIAVAGTVVVGAIYFVGLMFEQDSRAVADRFSRLEALTARVSEGLLQGREIATGLLGWRAVRAKSRAPTDYAHLV